MAVQKLAALGPLVDPPLATVSNRNEEHTTRVVAIDPNTAGFGYVVFEGP
jgi:hypothetical protein